MQTGRHETTIHETLHKTDTMHSLSLLIITELYVREERIESRYMFPLAHCQNEQKVRNDEENERGISQTIRCSFMTVNAAYVI